MKTKKTTMKHAEKKETPSMEAKYHSSSFLKKAVKAAQKKGSKSK